MVLNSTHGVCIVRYDGIVMNFWVLSLVCWWDCVFFGLCDFCLDGIVVSYFCLFKDYISLQSFKSCLLSWYVPIHVTKLFRGRLSQLLSCLREILFVVVWKSNKQNTSITVQVRVWMARKFNILRALTMTIENYETHIGMIFKSIRQC